MRLHSVLLIGVATAAAGAPPIEHRRGREWPSANHFRIKAAGPAQSGSPVWLDAELPPDFNPDSVRVLPENGGAVIPAKTEWRRPRARVSWRSTGSASYFVYFDTRNNGETARLAAPAMVGTGDRLTYGRAGVKGNLAVGLWAFPAPVDMDGDGDPDLAVACTDRPYNGTYLFKNIGSEEQPLFDRAEWLGPAAKDLVAADFNGDGALDLVTKGGYFSDVPRNRLSRFVEVKLQRDYHVGRDDLWYPADWDGDGRIDLLNGVSDWRDYGWDDAFDEQGEWLRGPLHGYVYFFRNAGSNESPRYEKPRLVNAGGKPIDQYGSPSPNPVDWFGSGRLDLILGNFIDRVFIARNRGSGLDAPVPLEAGGKPIRLNLCMIQPRAVRWHKDGRPSLMVAEEDGTISFFENEAPAGQAPRLKAEVKLQQVDPFLKSGALSRPVAVDWNADGLLDIVSGNSAGFIQWFENVGTTETPSFADRGGLRAGGQVIRRIAGPNGSVQGPAEEKWGYSNPWVADWDGDGRLDLLVNDIWGAVVWYRNIGTPRQPELAAASNIEVEWKGAAPKPDWVWWEPAGKQLVTQWRTTPRPVDWNGDGLMDLVMLNHQGYLSLFRRVREDGQLKLLPPERIFLDARGRFLNLSAGRAGRSGRRKADLVDWDGDGDLDLLSDSDEGPIWFENTGSMQKPVMELRGPILKVRIAGHNPTPNAADWNGDGRLDLLVGAEDGFFYYFERSYIEARK